MRQLRRHLAIALLAACVGGAAWADEAAAADAASNGPAPEAATAGGASTERTPTAPAAINVRGRVLARGSINAIPSALVTTSTGQTTTTDEHGDFALALPVGDVEIVVSEPRHQLLHVRETVPPGVGLRVEYLLLPLPENRRFESTVHGASRHEGEHFSLAGEALQTAPGTAGDPFRSVGLLPGVTTPVTLLPIFAIRGASPGMNGFFLDGMRVPQLFHLLIGGGVVHGRLLDRIDYYPGSYDASFGHFAGGIIDAETRPARGDGQHAETQLRVIDVSTAIELALAHDVRITVSGSFGWPGALIGLLSPGTNVTYGDYQLRVDWRGLTLQALGSYDSIESVTESSTTGKSGQDEFRLMFHRLQLRYRGKHRRVSYEAALVGGYDQMRAVGGNGVEKLSLGWRGNVEIRRDRVRLSLGSDGELSRFRGSNFEHLPGASINSLGELAGNRTGTTAGAYAALTVDLIPRRLDVTLSGRADLYAAADAILIGLDPRLNLRAQLLPQLVLKAGGGVYHQPPTFPVALPGVDTFALRLGLQTAYHSSLGLEATLPRDFSVSLTGFYQRFQNVDDAKLDNLELSGCAPAPPEGLKGAASDMIRVADGQAYGGELLLRRQHGAITGWVAYTLGRSERFLPCGARPSDFDQTHTLNVVVQAHLPKQLMLGGRLYVASGRPATAVDPALGYDTPPNNWRMPPYVQLDLRLDREWIFKRWAFDLFVEILNVTFSKSALGVEYPLVGMSNVRRLDQPQVVGFRWVLPTFGLRGRF